MICNEQIRAHSLVIENPKNIPKKMFVEVMVNMTEETEPIIAVTDIAKLSSTKEINLNRIDTIL
jgi:hypothetical protein